jgi:metal-responsive CopG/Arc/MetJ family transcriptional regulator
MPRTGERRVIVGVRLKADAIAYIDALAEAEKVNRSEMVRILLAEAVAARRKR